jgi:hypothetical protein
VFSDPSVRRVQADALWRGQQVITWTVLLADGGRYYLPEPAPLLTPGETPWHRETAAETVTESDVKLAQLLHELTGLGWKFRDGLHQSGVIVVPG